MVPVVSLAVKPKKTSDQTIVLTGNKGKQCPYSLRTIGYRGPETKKHYVFLTNNYKLSAKTIADI